MKSLDWPVAAMLVTGMVVGLAGCKPNEAIRQGAVIGKGTKPNQPAATNGSPVDETTAGSIRGTVNFSGNAPERLKTAANARRQACWARRRVPECRA